jgi:DDE superfamily endonuclease
MKRLPLRVMFQDEARFGRINTPRACWAPAGVRPAVAAQAIRQYTYLYGAISPKDGLGAYLVLPDMDTVCMQIFLDALAAKFSREYIALIIDGAPNHRAKALKVPDNMTLIFLPPYSPELNPKENIWDEIREKIFKNYALKSMAKVEQKLCEAALYIDKNPDLVRSIAAFDYITAAL